MAKVAWNPAAIATEAVRCVEDGGLEEDGGIVIGTCGIEGPVPIWNTALPTTSLDLLLIRV